MNRTIGVLSTILIVVIVTMGFGAGMAKILVLPNEVEFFSKVGLNEAMLITFGSFQLLGSILFIPSKTRIAGGLLLTLLFGISSILIIRTGSIVFGVFSLLPILLIILALRIKRN